MNPGLISDGPAPETADELFNDAPSGYLYARSDGLIMRANATFLRWTGYKREDLVNRRSFADLLTVAGKIFNETHIAPTKRMHGFANELALDILCADGRLLPTLVTIVQKREADGTPLFDRIVVFNATERRRYEKELLAAQKAAEAAHAGLKAEHEALQRAHAALRDANAELEQFSHLASHDLQAPLRTMSMFVDVFVKKYRDRLDDAALALLERITNGAQRMEALVNAMLSLSRSRTPPEKKEISLEEPANLAISQLAAAISEAGATVRFDHRLPHVHADALRLAQVFQNLIGNAIKYRSPDRPPEIRISAVKKAGEWEIAVSDNGSGFEPEVREQIFSAFKRLHGGEIPGSGIGLAICRKIVDMHGGRIRATSSPGQGSTFTFTLPIPPAPESSAG